MARENSMSFTYDHIHLRTPDVPRAVNFYKTNFDADVVDPNRPDGGAGLKIAGVMVLISPLPADAPFDAKAVGGRSLDHFAFGTKDLDAVCKKMKANGVVFTRELQEVRPGLKIAFILAPDNVSIELLQRG
jgi:lactoylglutathione lyase